MSTMFFCNCILVCIPSKKLTYPRKWHFEDDFPFPKVGYVNSRRVYLLSREPTTFIFRFYNPYFCRAELRFRSPTRKHGNDAVEPNRNSTCRDD